MEKIAFTIQIKASRQKIWEVLWDDRTYRMWTSVFCEGGSYMETDWKEGGRVLFLNGERNGMYSVLEKYQPFERISFKHLGEVQNGKEIRLDNAEKQWSDSTECYTLSELNGYINLQVEIDIEEEYLDYFKQKFPEGLTKVKALAEE